MVHMHTFLYPPIPIALPNTAEPHSRYPEDNHTRFFWTICYSCSIWAQANVSILRIWNRWRHIYTSWCPNFDRTNLSIKIWASRIKWYVFVWLANPKCLEALVTACILDLNRLSNDADTSRAELWEKLTAVTAWIWPLSVCRHSPLLISQILTVMSDDPDASSA